MRISDWSSDVCSSDLRAPDAGPKAGGAHPPPSSAPRAVRHWEDGAAKMVAFRDPARSGRGCPPSLAQSAHRKRGKLPYAARQNPMASVLARPNLCPAEDGRLATLDRKSTRLNSSH